MQFRAEPNGKLAAIALRGDGIVTEIRRQQDFAELKSHFHQVLVDRLSADGKSENGS
jgi:hypothetical protein